MESVLAALVDLRVENDIAVITLNIPERRNALSVALVAAILAALDESRLRGTRAVVLTGAPPAFCAGANIDDLLETGWMEPECGGVSPYDLFEALESDARPIIAAVNGMALGGGFELTLCCDIVFASEDATFAFPELGVGVVPNTALGRLAGIVGRRVAADLILTRRKLIAAEAIGFGVVNRVYPGSELLAAAIDCADRIVRTAPPSAVGTAKKALRGADELSWSAIRRIVGDVRREEWREGLDAFRNKRKPDFDRFWRRDGTE